MPAFLPDTPEVRNDILDYYFEVRAVRSRGRRDPPDASSRPGQLDNTIVVITSDNGMPFPRAKANLYDAGTHVPLAIRLPGEARAGQRATTSSSSPTSRRPCSKPPG